MGILGSIKDKASSFIIIKFINKEIEKYGEVKKLKIDSKNDRIIIEILLKGEKENIIVQVNNYVIENLNEEEHQILIKEVTTSRLWMTYLAEDFLVNKPIKIPDKFSGIVKTIL